MSLPDSIFSLTELVVIGKLIVAVVLGALLGTERWHTGKPAGVRTYALVALGAALYTIISQMAFLDSQGDPTRIVSQIVVGIGFLGAGLIIHHGHKVEGLTTAAGLWVVAAIGASVGLGFYLMAAVTTLLAFLILRLIGRIEYDLKKEGQR